MPLPMLSPTRTALFVCLTGLQLFLAGAAQADIAYSYSTTLSLVAGPDTSGLAGSTFTISFDIPSGDYLNRFGFPAVVATNEKLTISGSSVAGNNGVFSLPSVAVYPTFASISTEPGGSFINFTLPDGLTLEIFGNTTKAPGASNAVIGGPIELDDFIPATSLAGVQWFLSDRTDYSVNATISASDISVPTRVPEPASIALIGAGLAGVFAMRRRKKA